MSASLDDRVERFKQNVRGREVTNEDTLEDYVRWLKRFEAWNHDDDPTEVTMREFDQYLATETDFPWNITRPVDNDEDRAGYAYRTRIKALSAVKLWLKVAYNTEVSNEVQNIALGEAPDFDPHRLATSDVERILDDADDDCSCGDCKTMLTLGYDAVMRAAEICEVRRQDVSLDHGTVFVHAKKGSMDAEIGLDRRTVRRLREHMNEHPDREYLFHNLYGRRWEPKALAQHFVRYHHKAGIHSFTRHSPIIHRLNDDQPLGQVSRRARHQNIATTKRYARVVGAEIPEWAEDE